MQDSRSQQHASEFDLNAAARQTMEQNGFDPDFPAGTAEQLAAIKAAAPHSTESIPDLRNLLWSSIDNDTSRDLDQIEYADKLPDGGWKVLVGVADVDAYVAKGTPINDHAAKETTTVYTGVEMFPMLPPELSTGLTSLLLGQDRACMVVEFAVTADGHLGATQVYRALVCNKAQLTYSKVGAWLEDRGEPLQQSNDSAELEAQLHLQNEAAQALKGERFRHGALNLESNETQPIIVNGSVVGLENDRPNLASELIEEFMIAANEVVARTLKEVSSIRRIVKVPERWERLVELAAKYHVQLPAAPDSKALNDFLLAQQAADPDHFSDLSLAVVKLMGPGRYELERKGDDSAGHFGLAVQDYTHSTAPNRRFADLVTQRILKAWISKQPAPYTDDQLSLIAQTCTEKGDAARKVERTMSKRIAAVALSHHIGSLYDAIVTGVNKNGTFVRILNPHADGLLVQGQQGVDVGDKIRVKLIRVDMAKGYIDFARIQ